jgi:hypothetical protein
MPKGSPRPRAGRGRKVKIDLKRLEYFGSIGSSVNDAAREMDIPAPTLHDRMQHDFLVKRAWDTGRSKTRNALRRKQLSKALMGDNVMLIWLGKNLLDQTDSPIPKEMEDDPELVLRDQDGNRLNGDTTSTT